MRRAVFVAVAALFACRSDKPAPAAAPDPKPPARGVSSHGAEMDDAFASVLAMYDAPEGASPCESALNAFDAEAKAASDLGRPSYFSYVAQRDGFLAGCEALAPEARPCLLPRYQAQHRDACAASLPAEEQLSHLYVVRGGP